MAFFNAASARSQHVVGADALRRPVRELHDDVVEAEAAVDVEQQLADLAGFLGDLRFRAEHVRVVLRERPHTHESVQRARRFVAMHLAELRQAQRQLAVAAQVALEDLDVAGAVHRLDDERLLVDRLAGEHVLAERVPVARRFPQRARHELGRVDLAVARGALLARA